MKIAKPKNAKRSAKLLFHSTRPHLFLLITVSVLAIISTTLTIFGPKILGNMTTSAVASLQSTHQIDWQPIKNSALLLIVLYTASAIIGYIQNFLISVFSAKYAGSLRSKIIAKISKLPISHFDKIKYGDTLSIVTNDIETIDTSLSQSLIELITSLTMIIGILIMMLTISVSLSLIALIAVPVSLIFVSKIMGKAQKYFREQRSTLGSLNSIIEEDYTGHLIIKSNSHGPASFATFKQSNEKLYTVSWKSQFFGSLAFPITHIFTNLSYIAICIVGGFAAIAGSITIGNVQAFIQYVNQFNRPISQVSQIVATIQQALAAAERVFNFLELPEESTEDNSKALPENITGQINFSNIHFSYLKDKPVIKDFSASIQPGMEIAIVGPTGAGKTTLVNLLMRFYDPVSGTITIDGIPTIELKRSDVRGLFGMVLQDTWLFSGTIAENLRYGNHKATLSDIKRAAEITGVDHFIESLPHGYQTVIDEDSDNISAGEKQLLTITRALIANPPMMILDEATSNVDTRTEKLIQDAFDKLTHGRTSFVIAHRLSTIRNASLILVLKDGNIVEQGTHDELLAQNGFYAELYNSQFTK